MTDGDVGGYRPCSIQKLESPVVEIRGFLCLICSTKKRPSNFLAILSSTRMRSRCLLGNQYVSLLLKAVC